MIDDAEGIPMACAYCLLTAEEASTGPTRITYPDPDDTRRRLEVYGADQLVTKIDGRRMFTILTVGSATTGTTTCTPATVINGTWVCALHVGTAIRRWD